MFVRYAHLEEDLAKVNHQQTRGPALVLAADHGDFPAEVLQEVLTRHSNRPFYGAVFPKVISGGELRDDGFEIQWLSSVVAAQVCQMDDATAIASLAASLRQTPGAPVLTLVDGLSPRLGNFLELIQNTVTSRHPYIGGGGGSLTFQRRPYLFTHEGVFMDACITLTIQVEASVGVKHGWVPVSSGLIANKTDGNKILELNWRPAAQVYRELVLDQGGGDIEKGDFFSIAKSFPFGISRMNDEPVVRDPISTTEEGGLVCVGPVPEHSVLSLLHGNQETLLGAAQEAATIARAVAGSERLWIFDCISRSIFFGTDFDRELRAVSNSSTTVTGALTVGEIGSDSHGILEFYNKTIVVGGIREDS